MISTVGQLQSQVEPSLNLIYRDKGGSLYLLDVGGVLTMHASIRGKITLSRLKHFNEVFNCAVVGLMDRGFKTVETWVEDGNLEQERFAEFFGFEHTDFYRLVTDQEGTEILYREMRYDIPELDEE